MAHYNRSGCPRAAVLFIFVALYAFWSLGRALHEDGTTPRVGPDTDMNYED
ncbi:MAG: hypothetical protein AB7I34_05150 [Rhizobiaceae bacterium]